MNCEYCGRDLHLSHYENNKEMSVYDCTNCPVLVSFYFFENTGVLAKTVFMVDRHGRSYMWSNNYIKQNSYITDLSVTMSANMKGKDPTVVTFPKVMNINPKNVHEKFSFYMTFL